MELRLDHFLKSVVFMQTQIQMPLQCKQNGCETNGYVNSEAIYNPINSQVHSSIIWNVLILTNPKELGLRGRGEVGEGNISGNDVIITIYR